MPTQRFTLIVEGADLKSEPLIDELFQTGCDDATVGRSDGIQYVDFDREAASLGAAILSAVRDLEQFDGIHVTRVTDVDPAPAVGIAAPAEGARQSVGAVGSAEHRLSGFPSSATQPRSGKGLWLWTDFAHRSRPGSDPKMPPSVPRSTSAWNLITTVPGSLRPDRSAYGRSAISSGSGVAL